MRSERTLTVEEELAELDHDLTRLKIEYEQYFSGNGKREPIQLRAGVQRVITRYVSEPPRNATLKFKFNSLCARFQAYRAMWGRTLREIEAGTYRRQRFRTAVAGGDPGSALAAARASAASGAPDSGFDKTIDRVYQALLEARRKTGETTPLDREALASAIRKQADELQRTRPDAKLKFKVVIDGSKARLKASIS
jgi:hypothetical protein